MNYHDITHDDMLNGTGLRVVLWVAGCGHHCPYCQNPETHDATSGIPFDEAAMEELCTYLSKPYIEGITFSGGDPLYEANRDQVTRIAKYVKQQFPGKNIWLYTGFTFETIKDLEIIQYIDVMVDGPFIKALNDNKLHWKGSSNQRVIDVPKTLQENEIILI